MKIKKYVANSMPEVLKLVKTDLGDSAVILNTRTLRKSRSFGIGTKGQVEVTAAIDEHKPSPSKKSLVKRTQPSPTSNPSRIIGNKTKPTSPTGEWAVQICEEIKQLRTTLQSSYSQPQDVFLPKNLCLLAQHMETVGLDRPIANLVLKKILHNPEKIGMKNLEHLQLRAAKILSDQFQPPIHTQLTQGVRSVIALVGPSGVGKTTSAVRIATHLVSQKPISIAFITGDTNRVGGLEQLRAYAGILGIPVDFAVTPEEMREAINARKETDLILIDTTGIGPLEENQIEALSDLLREAGPNEIHLVLDATTDLHQMRDTVKAYAEVSTNRLLITKIDETGRLGAICTLAVESKLPLSFTTNGRAVPGNLHLADPEVLSSTLFRRLNVSAK